MYSTAAWRNAREDTGIVRVSAPSDPTGGRAAEEDERHLLEWKADQRAAAYPYSTAVDGLRAGHVERYQRYYLRTNKVSCV